MIGFADFEQWTLRRDHAPGLSFVALSGLYLRSRRAAYAAGGVLGIVLCAWGLGGWILSIPGVGAKSVPLVYIQVFAPVLTACMVGAGAYSPFGETERTMARPLPPLRFGHLVGLTSCAAVAFVFVVLAWRLGGEEQSRMVLTLLRNLAGFSGLTLLAAWIVGGRLAWVFPLVFSTYALIRGSKPDGTEWARWAWPMRPVSDDLSWTISLVLMAVGFTVICMFGGRESVQDSELGDS